MKTTKQNFDYFKKVFLELQSSFGLNNYHVYFQHNKLKNEFAKILTNYAGHVSTVILSTDWKDRVIDEEGLRQCALHECCHLLIGRLSWLGRCRFVDETELDEEDESLVVRLVEIFK